MKVTFVPAQITFEGLAAIETLAVTFALTVIVIAEDVAGLPFTQVALLVITQVIASLLTKALFEYVVLFVPTLVPFFFHWYDGVVPPFVGVAINVTFVPAHIVVEGLAAIETLAVTFALTLIVIALEVEGLPFTQVALLVITQVIASLLFNVLSE